MVLAVVSFDNHKHFDHLLLYIISILEHPPTKCEESSDVSRQSDGEWYSGCNCFGYFKPRQCYFNSTTKKYECWCSDDYGYLISGTQKSFSCSEKLTE